MEEVIYSLGNDCAGRLVDHFRLIVIGFLICTTLGVIEAIELYWFYNIGQNMQLGDARPDRETPRNLKS
jgi:hypothetical protein